MATSKKFIEYFAEQINMAGAGEISCRPMFGDYGIYCDGVFFALVYDEQFFVKITEAGKRILDNNYPTGLPYDGAKTPAFLVEDFENRDLMRELIFATCEELSSKKNVKAKKEES